MKMKSNILYEVIPVRLFLIILLVFYHAFAIFSGSWPSIEGFHDIRIYDIMDKLSYACLLETFVFISGYILGYQVRIKGHTSVFKTKDFLGKKFKRLIIPSLLFSLIYVLSFGDLSESIIIQVYKIVSGAGHMWFLPMLFWCFSIVYILEKFKLSYKYIFPILVIVIFCSALPIPLRINNALYYVFFFYTGYYIQKNDICINRNILFKIPMFLILFSLAFILKLYFSENYPTSYGGGYLADNQMLNKIMFTSGNIILRFICASFGVALLMNLSVLIISNYNISKYKYFLKLSECCFGVYIFQQFILKLFNRSQLPYMLNEYLYPWVIFLATLILSLVITVLFRKTKLGKQLL